MMRCNSLKDGESRPTGAELENLRIASLVKRNGHATFHDAEGIANLEATKSKLLLCSGALPWRGFRLTKQLFLPKSFFDSSFSGTDRHLISMLCSPVSRGERLDRNGQCVRYTKLYAAITILPSRFIAPPEHLITPSEYLYCSFAEHFINAIMDEMGITLLTQH